MDRAEVEALLRDVAAGSVAVEAAVETLAAGPMNGSVDLGFARVDTHRGLRTGDPEVVYAAGKTADQTVAILRELARQDGGRPALATRLPDDALVAVRAGVPGRAGRRGGPRRRRRPAAGGAAARCASWRPAPRTRRSRPRRRSWPGPSARASSGSTTSGSPGIHRLMAVRDRLGRGRLPRRRGRHGGRAAERGRRADRRTAGRGADLGRLRRLVRRSGRAARDAQLVRARRRRCATSTTASAPGCSPPGWPGGRPCGPPRDGRLGRRVRRRERRHAARRAGRRRAPTWRCCRRPSTRSASSRCG